MEEVRELEEVLEDKKKAKQEAGDILRNVLNLFALLEVKHGIKEEEILLDILFKDAVRKPWLFLNKKISEGELLEIWHEGKKKEEDMRD